MVNDKLNEILAKIDIRKFYLLFIIAEMGIIFGSILSLYANWLIMNLGGRIASVFQLLFNVAFLGLFLWLYKITPKPMKVINEAELDNLLNKYSKSKNGGTYKNGEGYIR